MVGGFALGLVLGLLIIISGAHGELTFDIGLARWDGLYLIFGLPLVLGLLFLLVSPVAWLIYRLLGRHSP
jgi:hypothetical protein